MALVNLRNVNPMGAVDLPIANRQGEPFDAEGSGCLMPGEVFAVEAEIAGHGPHDDADDCCDGLGSGLLAQVGNYELAEVKPTRSRAAANPKE